MTNTKHTINQVITALQPEQVLVKSTNYLQFIKGNKLREVQKCYTTRKWYELTTKCRADNPQEIFVQWIDLDSPHTTTNKVTKYSN